MLDWSVKIAIAIDYLERSKAQAADHARSCPPEDVELFEDLARVTGTLLAEVHSGEDEPYFYRFVDRILREKERAEFTAAAIERGWLSPAEVAEVRADVRAEARAGGIRDAREAVRGAIAGDASALLEMLDALEGSDG